MDEVPFTASSLEADARALLTALSETRQRLGLAPYGPQKRYSSKMLRARIPFLEGHSLAYVVAKLWAMEKAEGAPLSDFAVDRFVKIYKRSLNGDSGG